MLKKIKYLFRDLPVKSYIIYLCVALFLTTGVTFSRYITTTTSGDGARVAQFGELSITESTIPEKFIFAPGFTITTDPKVRFSPNEMSAYVFVAIDADSWVFNEVSNDAYSYDGGKLTWSVNTDDWTYVTYDSTEKTAVFYKLVPPGEELNNVSVIKDDTTVVSENVKRTDMDGITESFMDITFRAYAVQSGGFETAESAWNSVKNK